MRAGTIIDSSVLVSALVDSGPEGVWSEQVIAEGYLAAPQLVVVESMNILRRLERRRRLTGPEASTAQRNIQELDIELLPIRPFEERIWQLRKNLTCYDAWYVAVAEALELPLATLDRRLSKAPSVRCDFRRPG